MNIASPPGAQGAAGLHWDELALGQVFASGGMTVTEDSVIRFASEWDMQPFHVDAVAAKESVFGTLVGSGLQTILLTYRLYHQTRALEGTAMAGLGIDKVRFLKPLMPGSTVSVTATVLELKPTAKPDRGVVVLHLQTFDQDRARILDLELAVLVKRRVAA
jgi:acyl dehydratase